MNHLNHELTQHVFFIYIVSTNWAWNFQKIQTVAYKSMPKESVNTNVFTDSNFSTFASLSVYTTEYSIYNHKQQNF